MTARTSYQEFGPVTVDVNSDPGRTITVQSDAHGIVRIIERWADPTEDEDMGGDLWIDPDQAEQLAALLLMAAAAGRTVTR